MKTSKPCKVCAHCLALAQSLRLQGLRADLAAAVAERLLRRVRSVK